MLQKRVLPVPASAYSFNAVAIIALGRRTIPFRPITMSVAELNSDSRTAGLIRLLRPREWTENAVVLAPLVFAGAFRDPTAVIMALLAFLLFCATASAVYVLNDLHDVADDRLHPVKKLRRPLAAGQVSTDEAKVLLIVLYCVVGAFCTLMPEIVHVVLSYIGLNIAHTWFLKRQPVIDIFSIST